MLIYEDKSLCFHGDNDDIKYDAEQMSSFNEQLDSDYEWFKDRARILEGNYIKYCNNETFVGDAADASKKFIMDGQCGELHAKNILIKKEFVETCFDIEELFKEMVDSSSHARISTKVLLKIKKDFGVYYAIIDTKGFEIERRTSRLVNDYSKWGITTIPNYHKPYVVLEGFCDNGGFLDECIRKLEDFDRDAYNYINGKDFITRAEALKTKINNTAGALSSMTVYQPNIPKASVSLVSLSTAAAAAVWNPFESLFGSSGKNIVVKKTYTEAEYIQSMKEQYGFSEDDSKIILEAYTKFKNSSNFSKVNKQSNIWIFYGYVASLFPKYSGDDEKFKLIGSMPTSEQALVFFDSMGIDGEKIKDVIINQHENCGDKRDFVHECAIISIMSSDTSIKSVSKIIDNPDSLVGYKGDIYSGSMGIDDMKSDVAAVNIYNRMRSERSDADVFQQMVNYNIETTEGTVNEAEEFLDHYGNGDVEKGLEKLKKEMNRKSIGTDILSEDVDEEKVEGLKKEFIGYLEKQLN